MAAAVAACASEGSSRQEAFERNLPRTQARLTAAGDADSLAVAAELAHWPSIHDPRQFALLTRAATLAPERADLVWLEIDACGHINTCDPTPLVETLHRVDPENGAAWAPLLDAASKRGDTVAMTRYLDAIANSKRFDVYWNASIAHMTAAVLKVDSMHASAALTTLIGIEAAFAIPAYEDIARACKAPVTEEPERLHACRGIASVMRHGDTYLTELMGIAIARRVWPKGSTELMDAVAARRLAYYRVDTQGSISVIDLDTNAGALNYLELLTTYGTEQEVALAAITRAGKSPSPPAGWNDVTYGGSQRSRLSPGQMRNVP